jgi:hypothetical protein
MTIARALIAVLLLGGCTPRASDPLAWLAEPGVVYCYRTLAAPDCYRRPLPDAGHRLIAAAPQVFFTPAAADR